MFEVIGVFILLLVAGTLICEHQRAGGITLLSLLTLGNLLYGALTPTIAHYAPGDAIAFEAYLSDAGVTIDAAGLLRVMLAAMLFQLACFVVALRGDRRSSGRNPLALASDADVVAAINVGWAMLLLGLVGVVWLGLIYNGHIWGLYEISYAERSPLFRENSTQAFLLLLGVYGASQLVAIYLMTDRLKLAALILLAISLHGLGIKSKFPIFWVFFVFLMTAIGERKKFWKLLLPAGITASILLTMSILRGADNLSELPDYISSNQEEIGGYANRFWENDIPGPASITYYVLNDPDAQYSLEPLLEIPKLLIPKSVYDRGPVVSDAWAAKMMESEYELGLGFGWSLLCDGYLLAGWLGVLLVAYCVAKLARHIFDLKLINRGHGFYFYSMLGYTCGPLFFYGVRESLAGLVKALLVMAIVLWLPTFLLSRSETLRTSRQELA